MKFTKVKFALLLLITLQFFSLVLNQNMYFENGRSKNFLKKIGMDYVKKGVTNHQLTLSKEEILKQIVK